MPLGLRELALAVAGNEEPSAPVRRGGYPRTAERSVHEARIDSRRGRAPCRSSALRNGIFLAPFHPVDEDPTLALRRDLELVEYLDRIGYEEAWIGEHHSAGYEIIASPELFIAAAAERTRRIRLGTGVISLPYHNPLMVADRMIQLDHMTQGRAMFGVGPGLLPSDAHMLGHPGREAARPHDRVARGDPAPARRARP